MNAMKKATKVKQIVVRFDRASYDIISEHANLEHRGLGEFIRHTALVYIEKYNHEKEVSFFSRLPAGRVENNKQPEPDDKEGIP